MTDAQPADGIKKNVTRHKKDQFPTISLNANVR